MNESTAIIDSVEIIPLGQSISPLITKVKIKVFHLGLNRNRSYIDKETAIEMAKSLRGNPIVGAFREEKGDFTDHGQQVVINDQGVKIECLTKPYGFVDLNAKVWFENYVDIDEFGNELQHTYVVTEGVVWSEQFPELKDTVCGNGRPHSMELDEKNLNGVWSTDYNSGVEFFIINDALISKLCILGEDTEPCFMGSSVTPEYENFNFSLIKNFKQELDNMKQELNALKGEAKMDNENIVSEEVVSTEFENSQDNVVEENEVKIEETIESASEAVEESLETPAVEFVESQEDAEVVTEVEQVTEEAVEEVVETPETVETETPAETVAAPESEFKCGGSDNDNDEKKNYVAAKEDEEKESDEEASAEDEEESKDDEKKKYSLLENEYNELKSQYALLEEKYQALVEFKAEVEDKQKDEIINSFSMLTDEEKAEVVNNKASYTVEEVESKLSVVFARKQRTNAEIEAATEEVKEEAPMVYSINEDLSALPEWVKVALEAEKQL